MAKAVDRKGLFLWQKFPKFVLGFLLLSVLFSVLLGIFGSPSEKAFLTDKTAGLKNLSEWAFQLTFIGVGLRTSFRAMFRTGVKPLVVGVAAEAAVALFTLGLVFVASGLIPTV
jgi:uncharacterized membrane protein YadS